MRELILQACKIASRHRSGLVPAIVAELELLSLGFDAVRFTTKGCDSARFMGVWYPLGGEPETFTLSKEPIS